MTEWRGLEAWQRHGDCSSSVVGGVSLARQRRRGGVTRKILFELGKLNTVEQLNRTKPSLAREGARDSARARVASFFFFRHLDIDRHPVCPGLGFVLAVSTHSTFAAGVRFEGP
jgi:hypothetical protein